VRGPGTYERIWRAVRGIPRGRVATYGQVASLAGFPSHARMVGYALHTLPPGFPVPWHRVINERGMISFPASHINYREQRALLEREGIRFVLDRVDMAQFGWRPRSRKRGR
jgi:methylated-DNA-protein-cysteine methyltransferase-like protein